MDEPPSLTEQLQRFAAGDRQFAEVILREILPTLRQIAVRELGKERYRAPVCPTELVNEVWIRNFNKGRWKIQNRQHFYAIVGKTMHQILVDLARRRLAQRRGDGEAPISLDGIPDSSMPGVASAEQVIEIGILVDQLEKENPEAAQVFRLVHFIGYTLEEIAANTGLKIHEVRRLWEYGRDWIKRRYRG
jgi:RNA polymerase sigma factor (TIGR02999 family)